ncbi:MAG: FAD-dependent monooxygenase [Prochlorococcaceae cyanobacterium]
MVAPLQARVNGAGPTGSLAALALARAGWSVTLVDPLTAEQLRLRGRAYALSHSSLQLLDQLQLRQAIEPHLVPFRRLQLCDLAIDAQVSFSQADLPAGQAGQEDAVGWIVQHGPLMSTLLLALAEQGDRVQLRLGPAAAARQQAPDPAASTADLVVAADGSHSPSRSALGVGWWQWPYQQACLALQVQLRGSDDDEAWELFRPEGPFAVLPLGAGVAQLVWSAPLWRCRQLEGLTASGWLDALASALPERFQPDALLDTPAAFPVALGLARRLHRGRTVLVGESAHRCHPVGGQGLNLCWRDVAVLSRLAGRVTAGRLPKQRLAAAYGRRRWPDLLLTLLATDLLVRLFSNRQPLLLPLRRLALAALGRLAPLRRLALAVMTLGPCRGLLGWSQWKPW